MSVDILKLVISLQILKCNSNKFELQWIMRAFRVRMGFVFKHHSRFMKIRPEKFNALKGNAFVVNSALAYHNTSV